MKLFISLGLMGLLCPCAIAADAAKTAQPVKDAVFAEMKQKKLSELDAKIQILQSAKTCLSAAADKASAKQCFAQEKAAITALRKTHKQNRADFMDKKEKRLQGQLKKVQNKKQQLEQDAQPAAQ